MPCHPHQFTRPFAALLGTATALLSEVAGRGTVVRHEAACGIAADNLLTSEIPCREVARTCTFRAQLHIADHRFSSRVDGAP
jgi:hypothetical protein